MDTSLELKDIDAFAKAAKAGSLSRASELYGISKSTLSHGLRRLEDHLGVELFLRSQRGLRLTDAGEKFLKHVVEISHACENAQASVQNQENVPKGKLRIACDSGFGTLVIGPLIKKISTIYPKLEFNLSISADKPTTPDEVDADCIIRVGTSPDSELVCRLLSHFSYGLYASPEYLSRFGEPQTIEDLDDHKGVICVSNDETERWQFFVGERSIEVQPKSNITVNSYWMANYFIFQGMGIGYLPSFFVQQDLKDGRLCPVLGRLKKKTVPAYLIFHKYRYKSTKLRVFIDHCVSEFSARSKIEDWVS